jgi:hypothetical protein
MTLAGKDDSSDAARSGGDEDGLALGDLRGQPTMLGAASGSMPGGIGITAGA